VLEPEPYIFSIGASALIVGTLAHPTAPFSGAAATSRADAPRPVLIPAPGKGVMPPLRAPAIEMTVSRDPKCYVV
jgi:hypothetical protein